MKVSSSVRFAAPLLLCMLALSHAQEQPSIGVPVPPLGAGPWVFDTAEQHEVRVAVTAKIGEGGMGEVYRARDTKLDRDVALKILPEAFVNDPERLARFQREAKAAATKMGVIMGKAAYMSPEQARGKTVDKRDDIWAFGVVLFACRSPLRRCVWPPGPWS